MPGLHATLFTAALLGLTALTAVTQSADKPRIDVRKGIIEIPLKRVLTGNRQPPPVVVVPVSQPAVAHGVLDRLVKRKDVGKGTIEFPLKGVLAASRNGTIAVGDVSKPKSAAATNPIAGKKFINPKVEPGKVRWHADFTAAVAAAKTSRKPVLLFQMIGRMDERFS